MLMNPCFISINSKRNGSQKSQLEISGLLSICGFSTKEENMKTSAKSVAIFLIFFAVAAVEIQAATSTKREHCTCTSKGRCFLKSILCPIECPKAKPADPKAKGCYIDCNLPKCEAVCRSDQKLVFSLVSKVMMT